MQIADSQMIEILKAVSMHESNIIIMDEPTSATTDKEVNVLFDKIAQSKPKAPGLSTYLIGWTNCSSERISG
jgi:inositol transport system ATP-binding protein